MDKDQLGIDISVYGLSYSNATGLSEPKALTIEVFKNGMEYLASHYPIAVAIYFVDCPAEKRKVEELLQRHGIPASELPTGKSYYGFPIMEVNESVLKEFLSFDPGWFTKDELQAFHNYRADWLRQRPYLLQRGAWIEMSDGSYMGLDIESNNP